MRRGTIALLLTAACGAAGCVDSQMHTTYPSAELLPRGMSAPANAPEGSCWQKNITPAVIDTVTKQTQVPTSDLKTQPGNPTKATTKYQTKTHHIMVKIRKEAWFETLCPAQLNNDLITALQHALKDKNLYHGAAHGRLTKATRTAIRTLQQKDGINSSVLSLRSAGSLALLDLAQK